MSKIYADDVIDWMQDVMPEEVTPEEFIRAFADDFKVDISPKSLALSETNKALKEALKKSHESTRHYMNEVRELQSRLAEISEVIGRNGDE